MSELYLNETNDFYTYLYHDENGIPIYVGKGKGDRAWKHFKLKGYFGNKLRKMVRDGLNPEPEFIAENVNENHAHRLEIETIKTIGRMNLGTGSLLNLTDGGEGSSGYRHTNESREKMSISKRGKHFPKQVLARIGRVTPIETRIKLSEIGMGHTVSNETRAKISKNRSGKPLKGESLEKMIKTKTGRVWICKPGASKQVSKEDATVLICQGWAYGRKFKATIAE